jgi:hypothetical protein
MWKRLDTLLAGRGVELCLQKRAVWSSPTSSEPRSHLIRTRRATYARRRSIHRGGFHQHPAASHLLDPTRARLHRRLPCHSDCGVARLDQGRNWSCPDAQSGSLEWILAVGCGLGPRAARDPHQARVAASRGSAACLIGLVAVAPRRATIECNLRRFFPK